jgi:hypothetical protein
VSREAKALGDLPQCVVFTSDQLFHLMRITRDRRRADALERRNDWRGVGSLEVCPVEGADDFVGKARRPDEPIPQPGI